MMQEALRHKKDWKTAQQERLDRGCENDSYVYLHLNDDDSLPHHVGRGFTTDRPWEMESRNNKHKNKVKKHGVRVEILCDDLTWVNSGWWEIRWIKALRNAGYDLTNLTDGGDGIKGYKHTQDSKDKMSESRSGANHHMFGKSHKKETCEKISNSLSGENNPNWGKSVSEETRQKLISNNAHYWLGKSGEQHPAYNRKHRDETKELLRQINTGKVHSNKTKELISTKSSGENNGMFGRKHTEEVVERNRQISLAQKSDSNYCAKHREGIARMWASDAAVIKKIFLSWARSNMWNKNNLYWGA